VLSAIAGVAAADPPDSPDPPDPVAAKREEFAANHLLGDWGGLRTSLWERGLEPTLLLITDPYGNPVGGRERGFTVYSMLCGDLAVDTEKFLDIPGGRFDVGFAVNFGEQLSQEYVGNVFPIQSSDVATPGTRLTNLSWTQSLLGDAVSVRAGRFSIDALYGEEFAGSEYFRSFTSVAFNAIPFPIFYNAPGPFGYPATTWGARVRVDPFDGFYAMAGVYDGNPDAGLADEHGLDFSFDGPPFGIFEIGLRWNHRPDDAGLPGNLKLGGWVLGGDVQEYGSTAEGDRRSGFYLVGDQSIVRVGAAGDGRHLGVFGSLVIAPDESVNPMPYSFSGGLVAYGPIEGRPKDFLAIGAAYGAYSGELRASQEAQRVFDPTIQPQLLEMTIEASYGIAVAPGMIVQPGVQVLVNPGGSPDTPTALAAGVNLVVSF
jgi:porin